MADFMDFNAWRDLAAASEEEVLQRQLEEAAAADAATRQALSRAGRDAGPRYGADGQLSDVQQLSQVGSYGDYLKAKQNSEKAWAAVNRGLARPDSVAPSRAGARAQQAASTAGIEAQEARLGSSLSAQQTSIQRQRAEAAQRAAEEQQKRDARAQTDKEAREGYLASLLSGAKGRAAAGGAQLDYVGSYNPYADSQWAVSQGAFEAQQARNAGASNEQTRSVWDAYTAKGGKGSTGSAASRGLVTRDPYTNMEEAMNPFRRRGG